MINFSNSTNSSNMGGSDSQKSILSSKSSNSSNITNSTTTTSDNSISSSHNSSHSHNNHGRRLSEAQQQDLYEWGLCEGLEDLTSLIFYDAPALQFKQIVIYTKSSLVEQTFPSAFAMKDNAFSVPSITFVDKDLDWAQIGGTLCLRCCPYPMIPGNARKDCAIR
jgi:hypothetical protein